LKIEVKALVAVVQSTSERDRNSEAGQEAFLELQTCMPWVDFKFYDEHTIDQCYRDVRDGLFSSLIFASNSLFNPLIYSASDQAATTIQRQSQRGMGIVILQQFLPAGATIECKFLPTKHQVIFRAIRPLTIDALTISDRTIRVRDGQEFAEVLEDFEVRAPTLWSLAEPHLAGEWAHIASAHTSDGVKTVIQRSRSPRARIIVSAIPLDWLARGDLLANLVARSVMFNGTLYVHPEGADDQYDVALHLARGRAGQGGRHLTSHVIASPDEIKVSGYPYRHFNHLLLNPAWGWSDVSDDLRKGLRRRLENEGSVTACADNSVTGVPMMVTVGGRPDYVQLADRFATWLARSGIPILDMPAPPIRAFGALAAALDDLCEHNDAVPRTLDLESVRSLLTPYFERRLSNGGDNVDRQATPTAAIASAMRLVGVDDERVDPLVRWLERGDYLTSKASQRQAKLWLPDLDLPDPGPPQTEIDLLYCQVESALHSSDPGPALAWLSDLLHNKTGSGWVSHRAIVAEALTARGHNDAMAAVAGAARSLHDDLDRAYNQPHPSLELIAMLTSALARVHRKAGFGIDLTDLVSSGESGTSSLETAETLEEALDRERDERVASERIHSEQMTSLRAETARAQRLSRTLIGAVTLTLWAAIVGVSILIFALARNPVGGVAPIVAGAVVVITTSGIVIGKYSAKVGCEPAFLSFVRNLRES